MERCLIFLSTIHGQCLIEIIVFGKLTTIRVPILIVFFCFVFLLLLFVFFFFFFVFFFCLCVGFFVGLKTIK